MPNNITVSVTADIADLVTKRAILSSELKAATADLNNFARTARTSGMTDDLRASMLGTATSLTGLRGQVSGVDGELRKLATTGPVAGRAMDNVFDRSRLAVVQEAGAKVPIFGSAIAGLGPAALLAAAGIGAVAAAMTEAIKAAEWAEDLKRAAEAIGLTTTQLQELDFVAQSTGIPVEKMRSSLQGLTTQIGTVQDALVRGKQGRQVKVWEEILGDPNEPEKAKKDLRDLGTDIDGILQKVVDFSSTLGPTQRAGIAQALRMDPQVLDSLVDAKANLTSLIAEAHQYGVIIPEDVIATSAAAAGKMGEWKAVIDGELRVAFINLAPVIAGAAQVAAGMADRTVDLIKGFEALGPLIVAAVNDLIPFKQDIEDLIGPIEGVEDKLGALTGIVQVFAGALWNALDPLAPFISGLEKLGGGQRRIGSDATDRPTGTIATQYAPGAPKPAKDPGLTDAGKKRGVKSEMSQWEDDLAQAELAIRTQNNSWLADMQDYELKFWEQKLATLNSKSKEYADVVKKVDELTLATHRTTAEQELDEDKRAIDSAKGSATASAAAWAKYLADVRTLYAGDAIAYTRAQQEKTDADREQLQHLTEQQRAAAQEALDELKSNLSTARSIREADAREAEDLIRARAKYSVNPLAQVQAEVQIAAIQHANAQQDLADLAAEKIAGDQALQDDITRAVLSKTNWQQAVDAKKKADLEWANQHKILLDQMANQEQAAALKIQQTWQSVVDPAVSAVGSQMKGLILQTETWNQALLNIGDSALSLVIQQIEKMVEAWIVQALAGKAANAGLAGSAGVASFAAAPWPIDLGAPGFGAAMAAAAAGFEQGINVVPRDMIAQIHAGERIMPAADNSALMSALGARGGGQRGGHTTNITYAPQVQPKADFREDLWAHANDVTSLINRAIRDGKLKVA